MVIFGTNDKYIFGKHISVIFTKNIEKYSKVTKLSLVPLLMYSIHEIKKIELQGCPL